MMPGMDSPFSPAGLLRITQGYEGVRHGALHVIETPRATSEINQGLQELHPGLFIEKQLTTEQEEVWCVVLDDGNNGLVTVFEWRDPESDQPIPMLSDRIVQEMQRRKRRGPISMRAIVAENERLRQERMKEGHDQMIELMHDHLRLVDRELPALRGSSPKVLQERRHRRSTGHFERAGQ